MSANENILVSLKVGHPNGELHLHNVHDGAANMMKTSSLLGCEEPQHCSAHVLNLLLVSDGLNKCSEVLKLLKKCRNIVTCLSFKSTVLINEFLCTNDDVDVYNKLQKIAEVKELVNLDEQFPIKLISNENQLNPNDNPVIADSEDEYEKNDNLFEENSKYKSKQHKSLKLQVCSR